MKEKEFTRTKALTDPKEETQTLLIEDEHQEKESPLILAPQGNGQIEALEKKFEEMLQFNRSLLAQQVELQKRLEASEAQREQERRQLVTSADGRGVQIPDGMRIHPAAHRVKLIKPVVPSDCAKIEDSGSSMYHTRYASERTIDRRLAEGWHIHPKMGDPGSGVKQVRDLIPIQIEKDHPDLINKKLAKEAAEKAHEREYMEQASRGSHYDPTVRANRFTQFKQEKVFERTKQPTE